MSIAKSFQMTPNGAQKMDGWASWRHRTRAEQIAERERYMLERSPEARRDRAAEREKARAARSVAAQLTRLDARPGKSQRERARFSAVSS